MSERAETTVREFTTGVLFECHDCTRKAKREAKAQGKRARRVVWRQEVEFRRSVTRRGIAVVHSVTKADGRVVRDGFVFGPDCPRCGGHHVGGKRISGRVSDHKCGARCRNATGHSCECECGGKNHGSGH